MARIPLPTRESLPEEERERWDRAARNGPPLNIARLLMANTVMRFDPLSLWRASGLSPRARELVILRAAFQKQSTYEWHQHVRIARDAGLSDADIDGVRAWRGSDRYNDDERALLAYVDELAAGPRPSDESFAAIRKGRSDAEVLAITMLITTYFQLAHVMSAFDLETEEPFVGWAIGG